MIAYVRSTDFKPNPRFEKYINEVKIQKIDFFVIGWDREQRNLKEKNYYYFRKKAQYGKKYGNMLNKLSWMLYVIKTLTAKKDLLSIVHAADFDSAFPSMLFCLVFKKRLIFDVCDWIGNGAKSDSLLIKLIEIIENIIVLNSDAIIVPEKERLNQIKHKKINKTFIMPNIPIGTINKEKAKNLNYMLSKSYENKIIVSYVGVFDYHRGIENLIATIKELDNIVLLIAGYGALENYIIEASTNHENIKYYGKVDYETALTLIHVSDLTYACYYKTNQSHKYAAPNKFYESLVCETPIITTEDTLVGNKTKFYNTGFVVGESTIELTKVFLDITIKELIREKSRNCRIVWENEYSHKIKGFMSTEYIPFIKSIGGENSNG